MRPFKCLDGTTVSMCQFPFESPRHITDTDMVDLEYQFMFLQKPRSSVSLDPENGIYYKMVISGQTIQGQFKEVDMGPIVAPESASIRPIKYEDLFSVDTSRKWFPSLIIE